MAKLTEPQLELLGKIVEFRRIAPGGYFVPRDYRPLQGLLDLRLVRGAHDCYVPTKLGRKEVEAADGK